MTLIDNMIRSPNTPLESTHSFHKTKKHFKRVSLKKGLANIRKSLPDRGFHDDKTPDSSESDSSQVSHAANGNDNADLSSIYDGDSDDIGETHQHVDLPILCSSKNLSAEALKILMPTTLHFKARNLANTYWCSSVSNPAVDGKFIVTSGGFCFKPSVSSQASEVVCNFDDVVTVDKGLSLNGLNSLIINSHGSKYSYTGFNDFQLAYSQTSTLFINHSISRSPNPLNLLKKVHQSFHEDTMNALTNPSSLGQHMKLTKLLSRKGTTLHKSSTLDSDSNISDPIFSRSSVDLTRHELDPESANILFDKSTSAPIPLITDRVNFDYPKLEHLQNKVTEATVDIPLPIASRMMFFGLAFPLSPYSDFVELPIKDPEVVNGVRKGAMVQEGLLDISIENWKQDPPCVDDEITIQYRRPLNLPIGPKSTKAIEKYRVKLIDPDNYLVVEGTATTPDVPAGSCFSVKSIYTLERVDNSPSSSSTLIKISTFVEWTKRSLLKSKIDSNALSGFKTSCKIVLENLKKQEPKRESHTRSNILVASEHAPDSHDTASADSEPSTLAESIVVPTDSAVPNEVEGSWFEKLFGSFLKNPSGSSIKKLLGIGSAVEVPVPFILLLLIVAFFSFMF
ncbi:GRAM domain-containing protein YSP2 [Smittium mucronatum]|uniref:GRAM domain-containing protein YSP2 n=1 Tax=Smittium mucronatum TaxID=133383 RepID=A0A1R0GVL5_9FUNG|nr:GRAM domain-containing protein YSP2 [Smittium mucronatum]